MTPSTQRANGRQALLPEISFLHVQRALKALVQMSTFDQPNPLYYLQLIDDRLVQPGIPFSPEKRGFEFRRFLTTLITEVFSELRRHHDRQPPTAYESKREATEQIVLDILSENSHLIGWSWLYYHHVRVDLNITRRKFRHPSLFHERTYMRYRLLAERRLTEIIYEREICVRRERKNGLLAAKLPERMEPLFGRTDVLEHLERLRREHAWLRIQVSGDAGIGKTRCVAESLRGRLTELDHLVWLRQPETVEQIHAALCAELGVPQEAFTDYRGHHTITLVLDGADRLYDAGEALEALLHELQQVNVFLIGRRCWDSESVDAYIALEGLDFSATQAYLHYLQTLHLHWAEHPLDPAELEVLWHDCDGNPQQLKRALYALLKFA